VVRHKNIPLLFIISKPPNFIYNRRQNLKTCPTKLGQGKNEHVFLPTFQVRPLCIPFLNPNFITCVPLFRLSFFFSFDTSVNGSHMNNVVGVGVRAGELTSRQPYSFFPCLDNNLSLSIVSDF